ncbi:hypothetical protein CB1_001107026 [Camelus ferus]|nr:hypothetical protein CB1_001107026 [Camelus ferus]
MRFFVSCPQVFEALQAEKVGAGVSSENGARARGCELGWRPTDRAAFPCACAHLPLQPFPHFLGLDPCARPTERSVRARALLPLPSPPTAPEAAGGATCVRFSLAGIASFLPGFWGSGKVTVTCSKEHWHSPERSGSGSVGNGSSRYSPSQNSPIHHIPSRRSPAKTITPQNAPRDEARGRSSFYPDGGDQETAKTGKFLKRFTDEESRVFLLDRGNTRDKEAPKEKGSEKGRAEGEWEDQEALDYFSDKESGKQKFNDSEGDDTEETEDYRQFRKSVLADQGKNFATTSHRNTEEEGPKYKSKVSLKGNRESDGFREEKNYKLKETGYVVERPSTTKDKHKEDDKNSERITVKKETQSPEQVKSEKLKDLFDYSPPLHKNLDAREKSTFREESPLRIKMIASDSHRPEVKLKMAPVPLDDSNRRIDISPSALRKHTRLAGEERVFKEENQKGDKKLRCDSADLRHDIDRRRKERSKERGDSKGSRESSGSRKQEKTPKDYKEYKSYKDDSSREEKESKKEREEEFKTHHELKEYSGFAGVSRPRGTFHDDRDDGVDYWAKRGRGRGTFQRGRGRFNFKKSGSSPKWTHDKYQGDGIVEDEEETMENNEEKKDRRKEEKASN